MTFLPVKSKFPIVISTFDSVNYLLSEKRLIRLFNEIKNILTDNGIFSFDASLYNNSLDHVRDYVSSGDVKGIVYRRNSKFNKMARIHKNIFEIVDKSKKTFKEIHKQKIYDFHKYFDLVYESGLKVVECYEAFTFKSGNAKSARVQFVVKKQSQ